jgi:hypothetical protein
MMRSLALVTVRLHTSTCPCWAGWPIKHVIALALHLLASSNSIGLGVPAASRQRSRFGIAAVISSAPAARMSNRRAALAVVTAMFSRIRLV